MAKHAVLIMHRTDIRTHRDGWVVVERHKDTTHTTPLLTLHTSTSHVVCHRILLTGIRHDAGGSEAVTIAYRRYYVTSLLRTLLNVLSRGSRPPVSARPPVALWNLESLHDETAAA